MDFRQELIRFADEHPEVRSIWKGIGVEGETDRDYYYFLTSDFFDWDLEDEVGN